MKKEYLLLFILFSILSIGNLINLCRGFYPFQFDNQILLSWQYWATHGLIPHKDIYYQYGLLFYYKGHNFFASVLYFFITPLIFVYLFATLEKMFKNKILSYAFIFTIFIFVAKFIGFEIFTRYGSLAAFSILIATNLFSASKGSQTKKLLILGVINGVIFPLLNDTGIYVLILAVLFLLIDCAIKKEKNWLILFVKRLSVYVFGCFIGIIPFILYLVINNGASQFINAFLEYPDLQQIAKTPFFHGFLTLGNLFTLGILIFAISSLCYELYSRKKASLATYVEIGLILCLIILEQKSIWRHIDSQLPFISLILAIFLIQKYLFEIQIRKAYKYLVCITFCVVMLILPFSKFSINQGPYTCQSRFKIKSEIHTSIIKYLQTNKDFNGKVFSFPGDTMFYVLTNQKPPYYPTSFEGSSKNGQEKLITYIKNERINYIIYNYKNTSIQDSVPNYVRVPYLHSYILNNFYISNKVGDFLIFKKGSGDFLESQKLSNLKRFKDYLLNVDLANIPRSEGIYKSKYLSKGYKVIEGSEMQINSYLKENDVISDNKLLVIKSGDSTKNVTIDIQTKDGLKTSISFKPCSDKIGCIINLENIPLFYKNRILKTISVEKGSRIKSIGIISGFDHDIFW